jgi:iron-sulfur cluster assembly protein
MEMVKESKTLPLAITETAYDELIKLKNSLHLGDDQGLRIGVKGGGCSGMSYLLAFDSKEERDEEFEYRDLKIFMDKSHGMYLVGMEIEFETGLNSRGFTFSNPNAVKTCGCGTSFSTT